MTKILIVEDESVIRTALRRLLERNGYEVSEAGSVRAAEKEHNLGDFDLVISDLRLPGAPGTDLIKKAGDVPVLIMTAVASLAVHADSQGTCPRCGARRRLAIRALAPRARPSARLVGRAITA